MVYCGKPSRGCQNCRERKIRCDQLTPGCTQCAKAQRQCPGYRNQLDLMFRNESKAVVKKALAREASKKQPSPSREDTPVQTVSVSGPSSPPISIQPISLENPDDSALVVTQDQSQKQPVPALSTVLLTPSDLDRGTSFFYTNYVMSGSSPLRGHFDYVPDLYHRSGMDEKITVSMTAVGLAGLANVVNAPDLMKTARRSYVNAIRLVNESLRSPTEAIKDSTLLTIMLLGIFETVTGCNQKSLKAWSEHINGAAALIKLRGLQQFRTHAGLRMFMQMTSNILINCVQREVATPAHIVELRSEIAKFVNTLDPAWRSSAVIIDLTIFRAAVREGTITDPDEILATALKLDGDFLQILSNLPPEWSYETVFTTTDPELVWNGCYHLYTDAWIAQLWNGIRTCRILLNAMIRTQLLAAFTSCAPQYLAPEYTAQFQLATDTVVQMRSDILASVPQCVGMIPVNFGSEPGLSDSGSLSSTQSSPSMPPGRVDAFGQAKTSAGPSPYPNTGELRASGGHFILWPLYLIGSMELTTDPIRNWVIARLKAIGDHLGVQQAHAVANFIATRERIWAWDERRRAEPVPNPMLSL